MFPNEVIPKQAPKGVLKASRKFPPRSSSYIIFLQGIVRKSLLLLSMKQMSPGKANALFSLGCLFAMQS
jgi:hypothetical protein